MNPATVWITFGSLLMLFLAGIVFTVFMITEKSRQKTSTLDTAEDLQRIDTKDPDAPRFSDKFVIDSSIP